ncbi:MAG: hypothetical protein Q7S40_12435 [Opitutaceae bacterium]|nr:hypothetical protein [Opitutaceae bacterium]
MGTLAKLARWFFGKFAGAVLIVALGLAAVALWLFLKDNADFERHRVERVQQLMRDRQGLLDAKADIEARIASMAREVELQQQRIEKAKKIIDGLRELESWWDRLRELFGGAPQQQANAGNIRRMEQLQTEAHELIATMKRGMIFVSGEKKGLDASVERLEREIQEVERSRSVTWHYLRRAWDESRWMVAVALAAFLFGPTLWALLMYYGFAAWATRGRPIRFTDTLPALPTVGESRVSISVVLRPGEVLRIKEKFLQASDEGVTKKTRFVLDWKIPLTSLACGLVELVELRATHRDATFAVTLSNADDPHIELAALEIPDGSSLVLRPSFLAGAIQPQDAVLRIKRHWQLARWQSWVTGQFRFFEFVGPCRLLVAGSRGVRAEVLAEREGVLDPARRTNQDATIGFTPNLDYKPVRAETFWSYYRGMNPLFDDLFAGRGVFVLQETSTPGSNAGAARFWSAVWNGTLKVFGL